MSWKLQVGCHRGTIVSRDSQTVETKYHDSSQPLDSLEDCIECAEAWRRNYAMGGYRLWVAKAVSPQGETISNIVPTSYPVG
jgi:hypothetical protein